MAETVN